MPMIDVTAAFGTFGDKPALTNRMVCPLDSPANLVKGFVKAPEPICAWVRLHNRSNCSTCTISEEFPMQAFDQPASLTELPVLDTAAGTSRVRIRAATAFTLTDVGAALVAFSAGATRKIVVVA
ncbi:MAG: hypothetical protein QOJ93_3045 [Actinomycetota bacterium]|nr:hypothetical protein [Actinomycetota bacterium]